MITEDRDIHLVFEVPVELPVGKGSFIFQSGDPRRRSSLDTGTWEPSASRQKYDVNDKNEHSCP